MYDWENWLGVGFYIGSLFVFSSRLHQKHPKSDLLQGLGVVPKVKTDKLITI